MTAGLLLAAALAAPTAPCQAQNAGGRGVRLDSALVALFKVDFAIPDAPAFDLVDAHPDKIMRPATVRQFAVGLSEFADPGGGLRMPKAFAVEVAPFLLAEGPRLTVADYQRRPWLYRLRVSGAVGRDDLERTAGSVGLRVSLIDGADFRADTAYVREVIVYTDEVVRLYADERDARRREGRPVDPTDHIDSVADLTGERRLRADSLIAARAERVRRAQEERVWNAQALDVALASRVGSRDSLGQGLDVTDVVGWATFGQGLGTWGQLLLGLRGTYGRGDVDGDFRGSGSLGTRLYVGSNRFKGFAEAQYTLSDDDSDGFFLNAGGEARLVDAVWATFSAGVDWAGDSDRSSPQLESRFALKFSLADLAN